MTDAPVGATPGFADLYRERYAAMVRLAYLLTSDQAVAEELVQDAFVRVWRQGARVQDPPAYLRRAVVNACTFHHHRRFLERRHPRVGEIVALDGGSLVAAGLVYDETAGPLAAVWSSADGGRGWVRDADATTDMGQGYSVTALVATADTLVALGDAQRLPEVTRGRGRAGLDAAPALSGPARRGRPVPRCAAAEQQEPP